MRSKLSIAGHPLHPMLVTIPIGLFVWTFFASLIYAIGDREDTWYAIAQWSGVAAIVTAALAAVAGFVDYLTIVPGSNARSLATGHMALNVVVLALFLVAWLYMRNDGARDGSELALVIALQGIGVALLSVSGWIGGEMVYRHHLAIVPHDREHEGAERAIHRPRHEEDGQSHIARPLEKPRT